jgi:hypothetical protein
MLRRPFLLLLGGFALLSACGGDGGSGPGGEANIAGTYNLQTINGASPPVTILQIGPDRLEITSGNFTVSANNTFSNTHTYRETSGGQTTTVTETCTGTYSRNGNSVSFAEATSGEFCGDDYNGTVSGNNLTVAYDAQVQAVYRR